MPSDAHRHSAYSVLSRQLTSISLPSSPSTTSGFNGKLDHSQGLCSTLASGKGNKMRLQRSFNAGLALQLQRVALTPPSCLHLARDLDSAQEVAQAKTKTMAYLGRVPYTSTNKLLLHQPTTLLRGTFRAT